LKARRLPVTALSASFLFAQIIGLAGCAIGIAGYLLSDDGRLKAMIGASALVMALHYLLLGAVTGAGAALVTASRSFLSLKTALRPTAPLFVLAYLLIGHLSYETAADLLPVAAGICGTLAMFYLADVPMRLALAVTIFCWLLYGAVKLSLGGVLLELFYFVANAVTLYRMTRRG